jgi:putative transposase
MREKVVPLALNESELSARELAVRFTDQQSYFVSEASVSRLLKAHDLIPSPASIVMKAADEFHDKTTAPHQLWKTDFTDLKVIGWAGSLSRPCWITTRATSWPGSSAPR